jgi:hypothetical protein
MRWSVSKSKIFKVCPRKWYFGEILASPRSKDPLKKEVYLLKQLQSVHAWRGSLVDSVIGNFIIPKIRFKTIPAFDDVEKYAMDLAEKQLDFGLKKSFRLPSMTKSAAGCVYCAFHDVEYNGGLKEGAVTKAKQEISLALKNLLNSNIIHDLTESSYFMPQRTLHNKFNGINFTSTPDIIVFYDDAPPTIIDWKVHFGRSTDYWLQLGIYAYALANTKPHRDFPSSFINGSKNPKEFVLKEFQLLKNQIKEYKLNEEDICDIEDYIFESSEIMKLCEEMSNKYKLSEIPTARYPGACFSCQFKKICWGSVQ